MIDTGYCYPPDYLVLKNKLGICTASELEEAERLLVLQRIGEPIPTGDFDLDHLKAIHHHLLQDIYEWAGQIRTVEISKGSQQFQFRKYIETGMADIHRRIIKAGYFQGLSPTEFAWSTGRIIGDLNYVHPFREGNGRSQLFYLQQLAKQAGHNLDLTCLEREQWIQASREAHQGNYDLIGQCIKKAISQKR